MIERPDPAPTLGERLDAEARALLARAGTPSAGPARFRRARGASRRAGGRGRAAGSTGSRRRPARRPPVGSPAVPRRRSPGRPAPGRAGTVGQRGRPRPAAAAAGPATGQRAAAAAGRRTAPATSTGRRGRPARPRRRPGRSRPDVRRRLREVAGPGADVMRVHDDGRGRRDRPGARGRRGHRRRTTSTSGRAGWRRTTGAARRCSPTRRATCPRRSARPGPRAEAPRSAPARRRSPWAGSGPCWAGPSRPSRLARSSAGPAWPVRRPGGPRRPRQARPGGGRRAAAMRAAADRDTGAEAAARRPTSRRCGGPLVDRPDAAGCGPSSSEEDDDAAAGVPRTAVAARAVSNELAKALIINTDDRREPRGDVQPRGAEARAGQHLRRGGHPRPGQPRRCSTCAGKARTLSMELFFDTYETGEDVRAFTAPVVQLLDKLPQTQAPPILLFSLGRFQFQCVLVGRRPAVHDVPPRRHAGAVHAVRPAAGVRPGGRADQPGPVLRLADGLGGGQRRGRRRSAWLRTHGARGHRRGHPERARRRLPRRSGAVAGHRPGQPDRRPVRPRGRAVAGHPVAGASSRRRAEQP